MVDISEQKVIAKTTDEVLGYVGERIKLIRKIRNVTMNDIGISRLWQIAQLMDVDIGFFTDGLNENKPIIDNESLNFIKMFNRIRDQKTKAAILGLLKEI